MSNDRLLRSYNKEGGAFSETPKGDRMEENKNEMTGETTSETMNGIGDEKTPEVSRDADNVIQIETESGIQHEEPNQRLGASEQTKQNETNSQRKVSQGHLHSNKKDERKDFCKRDIF